MTTRILPLLVLMFCTTSLSAQITREQADNIVLEHLQKEVPSPYLLYVNVNTPSTEEITLTTYNEENMKVKYACWAYYLSEHPEVPETTRHRYLFVKENNGNLLEVITYNDLGPEDLTQWQQVQLSVADIERSDILIYPNPTTGELRVMSEELKVTNVEIFDIYGRMQKGERTREKGEGEIVMDISNLSAGIYFVKITTEAGIVTQKVIKN